MERTLEDKVAIVTGGSRGIGAAVAAEFSRLGARVVAGSRSAVEWKLDVTREESVLAFFEKVDAVYGRVDILVNNAGVGTFNPLAETTLADWENLFAVNVRGTFLCARAAITRMRAGGGGRIFNIGSIAGSLPLAGNGAYGASKAAVCALTHVINEEEKMLGIRATLVTLGAVATDIWTGRSGFEREDMLETSIVAKTLAEIAAKPLSVRVDEIKLFPSKGIL